MKLLINTATTYKGGSVQVALSFIQECVNYREHEYHVVLGQNLSLLLDLESYPPNFSFYKIGYRPAERVFSLKDQAAFLKRIEDEIKPDCVFTTSGPAYWRPQVPHLMGFNLAHYVYDDSPFYEIISFKDRLKWRLKGMVIKYFTKKDADYYVTQTDDINTRLKKWIKKDWVYTVSNTYGGQFEEVLKSTCLLPEKEEGEFRFLILSGYHTHKNLPILKSVVEELKKKYFKKIKFVLTLPDLDYKKIRYEGIEDQIINVGPVKPVDCPGLYRECDAIFLPTLLECFSATYAEAMKMQLPIITTDLGFARTVCGDAALYFSPLDSKDAAEQIIRLYRDQDLRNSLILQGEQEMKKFMSARERAEEYLRICEEIKDRK